MVSAFLVVCACLCITVVAQEERGHGNGINWEPFEVQETLDRDGISMIKGLPLYQYWDVLKGSFRTGLIGDTVYKAYPQFVSVLEKKAPKGGKLSAAAENYAIDFSALYMYSLLALQHLIQESDDLTIKYELSTGLQTSKRNDFGFVRQKAFASIAEIGVLKAVQEKRRERLNTVDSAVQNQLNIGIRKLQFRNTTKRAHMRDVHDILASGQREHFGRIHGSHAAKYNDLNEFAQQYERTKLVREKSALVDQHDDEVAQLRMAINVTMDALSFRAAEELRIALQQQKFEEEELLGTRSELLQAEVEKVINASFAELYMWGQMVADDPSSALAVCKLVLAGIAALLLVLELRQLCLSVLQKLSWASYYPTVARLVPRSDAEQPGLRWSAAVQAQVDRTVQAIVAAAHNNLVLPNLLIAGASGTGKSALIKKIVCDVAAAAPSAGLEILSVCGADLLALGDAEAALFLNNLIRKHSHAPSAYFSASHVGRLVIVVDDADCIIACRESQHQQQEPQQQPQHDADGDLLPSLDVHGVGFDKVSERPGTSSSVCLFSLLAGLRENSQHISLVLATRLDVSKVDSALMDRIDATISVDLPSECERLAYAVAAMLPLLDKVQSVGALSLSLPQDRAAVQKEEAVLRALSQALLQEEGERAVLMVLSADLRAVLGEAWSSSPSVTSAVSASVTGRAAGNRHGDPETDRPLALTASADANPIAGREMERESGAVTLGVRTTATVTAPMGGCSGDAALALAALRRKLSTLPDAGLDLQLCLGVMLLLSARWSYRDLKQFFSALNYAVMCSERCELTTKVWMRELVYTLD